MILFSSKSLSTIMMLITFLTISACSQESEKKLLTTAKSTSVTEQTVPITPVATTFNNSTKHPVLDVYKSPTCGCCEKWLEHIDQHGFVSRAHNQSDLSTFKSNKGIGTQYRSCHTAVSKEGYVFEGHVPAKFIHQFLAKPPTDAIGLSVPAMPIGTPGMEVGDKFMPYKVILLMADGSHDIYAELNNYQEQF